MYALCPLQLLRCVLSQATLSARHSPTLRQVQAAVNDYFMVAWAPAHFGPSYLVVYSDGNASNAMYHSVSTLEVLG